MCDVCDIEVAEHTSDPTSCESPKDDGLTNHVRGVVFQQGREQLDLTVDGLANLLAYRVRCNYNTFMSEDQSCRLTRCRNSGVMFLGIDVADESLLHGGASRAAGRQYSRGESGQAPGSSHRLPAQSSTDAASHFVSGVLQASRAATVATCCEGERSC